MELIYKVFITRKIILSDDSESLYQAEGKRVHDSLNHPDVLGIFLLNTEFQLTVARVKRLERMLGSVFEEKVQVIY